MTPDNSSMTEPGGGETVADNSTSFVGDTAAINTLEEMFSSKGRNTLRELALRMKESGALRIKDHRTIQGNFPNSFKGEYARDWILSNEKLVTSVADALQVGQAMLDLSIFHCVTNSSTFDGKHLYAFRSDNLGSVANLQRRVVAIEDQNIAQTKANKEAQAAAVTKSVQLDWRISVAERRLAASENTLRRIIVVQQVLIGTLLALFLVTYAPLGRLSTYLASLGIVVLIVVLLESRRMLNDFFSFQIDYNHIASGIMGMHVSEEMDDSMTRANSVETTSTVGHGSTTLDAATRTVTDLLSGVLDGAKASFDSAWSTVTAPATDAPLVPPRSILQHPNREKTSRAQRTTFTVPEDHGEGSGETNGQQTDSNLNLARRSMPVLPATADAVVAEVGWRHDSLDDEPVASWRSQPAVSTPRQTFEWPMYTPARSAAATPYSGGVSMPASPMGAPPGPPSQVDFEDWWTPDNTSMTMVVRQPFGEIQLTDPCSTRGRVRINHADCHEFDGPLFKGRIMIWVKGLPVGEGCEKVFKNKRRQSWVIVQGRFKRRVPVADLYTGQMFARKISDVPAAIITAVTFLVQSFTRVVSSASVIENTDAPMVIYPLILAAQSVHVSTPGYEPEVSPEVDLEDCSLMVPGEFEGHTPSVAERKAFFSKALNRKDVCYDPRHVYTFHIRQHVVDIANYTIPIPALGKFCLLPYLQGQPIRFMAYDRMSHLHAWNMEAWHRGLIGATADAERVAEGNPGAGGESVSPDSEQGSNTLGQAAENAARSCSSTPRADSAPFSAQKGCFGVSQELAWRKKSNDIIAFGHDGSFGHDGHHPIQRAPSNVAAYSSVSIAVPEPPVLGQDGSTAATPKLITHAEMLSTSQHSRGTHSEWPDGRKSCTLQDMLFNTAPSTFRPSFSAHSSHQQIGSDRASAHSAQIAVSEDGNAEWHSDKASDIPSDASRLIDEGNWATTPRSVVSADSMPISSRDTHVFETQLSVCHRRVASDASVTFRGLAGSSAHLTGSPTARDGSGGASSAPGEHDAPKKKSKFRFKKWIRRVTKH